MKWRRQAEKLLPLRRGGEKRRKKKEKKAAGNKPPGVWRAWGRACCLVLETVGSKWLADQIWCGVRGWPEGKHQGRFARSLVHILQNPAFSNAVFQGQIY